jgi:hypothetical protein
MQRDLRDLSWNTKVFHCCTLEMLHRRSWDNLVSCTAISHRRLTVGRGPSDGQTGPPITRAPAKICDPRRERVAGRHVAFLRKGIAGTSCFIRSPEPKFGPDSGPNFAPPSNLPWGSGFRSAAVWWKETQCTSESLAPGLPIPAARLHIC